MNNIYHSIIAKLVHEVGCFCALVVVEPDGSLKLVPSIQKQHVPLLPPDLPHFGEPPGDPREAGAPGRTLPRVLAGLFDPPVVVVGVEQRHLERRHGGRQQRDDKRRGESATTRPHPHRVAARKDAPVSESVQRVKKDWPSPAGCTEALRETHQGPPVRGFLHQSGEKSGRI